tara:strand:+ start:1267 stop:1575 length:309 start_codon:yes stop_codon:yes gene_type:complete
MENTKEIKLMIIENYIDWFTTDEDEREQMKENAKLYVEEDWVDEIAQSNVCVTETKTRLLASTEFHCSKCNTIHTRSAYAIAQRSMNVDLIFTCDCGNKIDV